MRKYLFRGFNVNQDIGWVYGSLNISKYIPYQTSAGKIALKDCVFIHSGNGDTWEVDPDSVGMSLYGELYEGDIFICDEYPFYSEGKYNYVGVVEYVPDAGYCGWYYSLIPNYERVSGGAIGSRVSDLETSKVKVVGNTYEHVEITNIGNWIDREFGLNKEI